MQYDPLHYSPAALTAHAKALSEQKRYRQAPYPAHLYDAHNDNVYHFVKMAHDSTLRAGYALKTEEDSCLFWYSRSIDGRMIPLYGAPDISAESRQTVTARPLW